MAAVAEARSEALDLGRVIRQTFALLGRRPALLFGLALALGGIATAINVSLSPRGAAAVLFTSPTYWFAFGVSMFLRTFLAACICAAVFGRVGGETGALDDAVSGGVRMFLPLFALNVLAFVGMAFGLLLLIVPGLVLAIAWSVAGPALVAERGGIFGAFRRSDALTRGNRWRILVLFLVYAVTVTVLQALTGTLSVGAAHPASPVRTVLASIAGGFESAVLYVGLATLYAELRVLKEGVADWGEVFD